MARCPFAQWHPITGPSGPYVTGPFKIVHHTTEGDTAEGAFGAFRANRDDPHFTVDAAIIYQHTDTAQFSRSLEHHGDPETNRSSAVQIEVVGFAAQPKDLATLHNVRRLCRWIEAEHGVPKVWPSGFPVRTADPVSDTVTRNLNNWTSRSGHYGHCHVPKNHHWDPGYSEHEVRILMQEVAIFVNGAVIEDAGGYLDASGHSYGWVRPIATAIGTVIVGTTDTTLDLERAGNTRTLQADIADGYAFIPLAALQQLPGITVLQQLPGITVTSDAPNNAIQIIIS